jgi:hypothetical protein
MIYSWVEIAYLYCLEATPNVYFRVFSFYHGTSVGKAWNLEEALLKNVKPRYQCKCCGTPKAGSCSERS